MAGLSYLAIRREGPPCCVSYGCGIYVGGTATYTQRRFAVTMIGGGGNAGAAISSRGINDMPRFAECDAVYWTEGKLRDGAPAGAFAYFGMTPERGPVGMYYMCPCDCGSMGTLRFRGGDAGRPSWEWNGNVEKPTLTPSVNHLEADGTEHWHGWLTAGKWISV